MATLIWMCRHFGSVALNVKKQTTRFAKGTSKLCFMLRILNDNRANSLDQTQ